MRDLVRRWSTICLVAVVASALSACSGRSGSGTAVAPNVMPPVMQMGSDAVTPDVLRPVNIYPGEVIGRDNEFSPADGDTSIGGHGQSVDSVGCNKVEHTGNYHVHFYVGLIVNGVQVAIPDAIGIMGPGPESNGYIKTASTCWYWIHTHDASGMFHIEDPRRLLPSAQIFTMQAALAVWGMKPTADSFGKFKGVLHVFVGNETQLGQTTVGSYTPWTKYVGQIPLRSHTVIWIEVGTRYVAANKLPPVTFYTEY